MKISSKSSKFLLFIILALAAFFRFYGLNWDQGHHLHPDERMIIMVAEKLCLNDLNPRFFAYGSLPIYLLKFSGWLVSLFFGPQWAQYSHLHLIGRSLSVIFDLATIFLIFKIGRKVFSSQAGLIAAAFYSLAVLPIQLSHFYAVDIVLNFFIFLTLYRLIIFYEKQNFKNALLTGVSFGLALATKISAAVLIVPIGIAFLLKPIFGYGLIVFLATIISFSLTQPYALLDFSTFWGQIQSQNQMTKDAFTFPYTLQYVNTAPYLYHLKNLYLWGIGIGLGSLSFLSALWYFFIFYRRRKKKEIILAVFFAAYFLIVGKFAVKFMRYFLPLYPLFCLYSAWFISRLTRIWKKAVLFAVFSTTFLWSISFISIYRQPNTRVLASQWINKNIPQQSKIAIEHWDDRMPMWGNYQFLEMPMYESDESTLKWQKVEQNLKKGDYLILASNRLYVPLTKLADCSEYKTCYPKTAQYYQDLFSGKLGFKKVAEFTSYPKLIIGHWSLVIRDEIADESFTVYDHPRVMIFKKIK